MRLRSMVRPFPHYSESPARAMVSIDYLGVKNECLYRETPVDSMDSMLRAFDDPTFNLDWLVGERDA